MTVNLIREALHYGSDVKVDLTRARAHQEDLEQEWGSELHPSLTLQEQEVSELRKALTQALNLATRRTFEDPDNGLIITDLSSIRIRLYGVGDDLYVRASWLGMPA